MADNTLLARLKYYKEFIAIVAAAIGGFVWFDGLVAKQTDVAAINQRIGTLAERRDIDQINTKLGTLAQQQTVDRISCLLKNYMTLSQRQLRLAQLQGELTRRERELGFLDITSKIQKDPTLLHTVANQTSSFRAEIDDLDDEIQREERQIREIRDFLEQHGCDI